MIGGAPWSPTVFLHASMAADVGRDRFPRVAGDGAGNWVCVWESTSSLGGAIGTDYDVLYSRSSDDGATWSAPAALNSTAATDGTSSDLSPDVAWDSANGVWLVVWQSTNSLGGTIGIDNDVFVARSTDAGATWSAAAPLNPDAATDQLGLEDNDNFPDVDVDGTGRFVAVWQRGPSPPTEYDIRRSISVDGGVTWSAPELVNTNGAADSGADSEPRVAASADGHWIVAWNSRDDLAGTIGTDLDVLATRFFTPDPISPGTRFCYGFDQGGVRCPCGNDAPVGTLQGCLNSTGVGADAQLNGTARISGPACRALGAGMPPNASALLFQGTTAVNLGEGTPFGDGLRCVGGSVLRIDTVAANGAGQINIVLPTAGLAAGDRRAYQIWYRNAASFCTASTFNLSSAFWTAWLP